MARVALVRRLVGAEHIARCRRRCAICQVRQRLNEGFGLLAWGSGGRVETFAQRSLDQCRGDEMG
jgi:hypothetical protein